MVHRIITQISLLIFLGIFSRGIYAQDTLSLNKKEAETLFLQNNLSLLVEHLAISKAEAELIQAKVWPNPTLTIDQVNLWKPKSKIQGQELVPPLSGDFGRNQQFGISIEQLIITAGKRKKLMALEKVNIEQSKRYFENVLRNLKIEFRMLLNEMNYLQNYHSVYSKQLESIQQLTDAYRNQVDAGFLNKGEFFRLKAMNLEILNDLRELENEIETTSFQLKQLMHLPSNTIFQLKQENLAADFSNLEMLNIAALIDTARTNRPEYQISKLQQEYAQHLLKVEKAERIPNLSLIGEYNRGDAIYTDFVGFGVALDLPIFNRNKGNIRKAELAIKQAELEEEFTTSAIEKEITLAVFQLRKALQFSEAIEENYTEELDQVLTAYTENFKNKNMGIIQYLDFLEAYLENKNIILQSEIELMNKAEELNYAVGKDVIK
ncbi:TolC family protein [Brumimicrobium salinarum]|uniref:TolC family protein n=1 Tax=Brumimicrobium salinarum TaxID=2058658 RepID=A0A2I0R4L5_9FLAO|nr:TolC family protein [Brumimicrobium salinarum]PKR81526.1 TolC family protein [Brumimicrobium salinarum]